MEGALQVEDAEEEEEEEEPEALADEGPSAEQSEADEFEVWQCPGSGQQRLHACQAV